MEHRFLDMSRLALKSPGNHIPFSLGVRTQALSLSLVTGDDRGRFFTPGGLKTTMAEFDRQFTSAQSKEEIAFREYIGEMVSLIYAPVYVSGRTLYDAILNEPVTTAGAIDAELHDLDTCRPERETVFVPGLCPECGWDLEGDAESLALVCRNCRTLWRTHKNQLAKIRYGCTTETETNAENSVLLPFWRIEAETAGAPLVSYADAVKLANLPRAIQPGWAEKPFAYWAPAFKIRPHIFLRLCRQLSLTQPEVTLTETIDERPLYPVTLPPAEARESMKITLADIMRPARDWIPRLPEISIKPKRITLVYLPFTDRHHDLYAAGINVSINKNILAHAANL